MFNIKVDYPSLAEEEQILAATTRQEKVETNKVLSAKAILNIAEAGRQRGGERIHHQIRRADWSAPRGPRTNRRPKFVQELVDWGAGPRAGQFLINGGKALAAMDGRFSVALDDVRKIAIPVLRHRISSNFQAQAEGMSTDDVVERLIKVTPAPEIEKFA